MNAVNKRNTVQELRRRVKGGLRDRAKLHGLPTTGKPPYGYKFMYTIIKGKKTPLNLEPVPETYPIACKIWRWALDGTPIRRICVNLVTEGIPAPRGGQNWGTNTVHNILKKPIYGGRFFALKYEARRPEHRLKPHTYGNSSQHIRPVEE
jgi:hypothetical protein